MSTRPPSKVNVPAKPAEVRAFVDGHRKRFEDDLDHIENSIREVLKDDRRVYKIYSRGEAQQGEELKHPRKIRLKFNEFNIKNKVTNASLFDSPDVVG